MSAMHMGIGPALDASVRHANLIGSWAADRIIFVGEYTDGGDFPEGTLTAEELTEFKDESLYMIAARWENARPIRLPRQLADNAQGKARVVGNLVKHYYVCADAFGTPPEYVRGPEVSKGRELADVVLSKTG
ncbi:hypothetical protein DXG03_004094 [Asterophora parasitica]|uniref:Uncharacterized protein n=1 Tax=Asterophora parasitica TaxID=117018 RepID=A0A9P7G308_9AGAR|nr:hypothetical protein DXG03_004094 [Asterophora parasitica]